MARLPPKVSVEVPQTGELPATSHAILGLLTFGEMSGYDLGKLINETIARFFFNPAKSQIYAELRRLVELGLATEREVAQQRRPDKRLYSVTARGRKMLRAWLDETPTGPDVVRCPTCLKLFFGGLMDRGTLVKQVVDYQRQARASLAYYEQMEKELEGNPDLFFPLLVLRRGLAHERAAIKWSTDVLKELEKLPEEEPVAKKKREVGA
jgi:DNA-binding PadR family transcriptional regulator